MKFAHLSDVHLGFQKQEVLQKIEQETFTKIIDECISRKVDFVLIPGDLFHVNIPEMRIQKFAFAEFHKLYKKGIPVYAIYGSHDFSPISNSVIDLLAEINHIIKVTSSTSNDDGTITLNFTTEKNTGVKITGLPGLKVGRDKEWYEQLDRKSLESEPGFKIFMFHGGILDLKVDKSIDGEQMPLSLLPKGFAYYAGGHMHKFNHMKFEDYPHVVYPGTPFAGYHSDLEDNAKGVQRGFVLVEFDEIVKSVELVPIENTQYEIIEIDAKNRTSESVNEELKKKVDEIDPEGKVIIKKIYGEMTSGKTADVEISATKEKLVDEGALAVNISRNQFTSKEYTITEANGSNRDEIETNTLKENIGQLNFSQNKLLGDKGIELAKLLLRGLGQDKLDNEKSVDYTKRITDNALDIMEIDRNDS